VTEKATIHVKWVRSGIAFTRRQKANVRSLGLRRLNQIVERQDTPQNRGLVASIPHMVAIVAKPEKDAIWTAIPEYTIHPPVAAPAAAAPAEKAEPSEPAQEQAAPEVTAAAPEVPAPTKPKKSTKGAATKDKSEKAAKKGETKKAKPAAKAAKPTKAGKK